MLAVRHASHAAHTIAKPVSNACLRRVFTCSGNESRFSEHMGALMRKHITALVEGSPMQRKIGFAFVAAAIGVAMIALGLAGTGAKETERASASLVVQALPPVW